MLYLFRIISDEEKDFCRDILIDQSDTFLDFHRLLQKNLKYDPSQLASFYITNDKWEKLKEITLIEMEIDEGAHTETMEKCMIGEYIFDTNQRLLYVFDFFSDRAFYIELMETFDKTSQKPTPLITSEKGTPPPQLMFLSGNDDADLFSDDNNRMDPDDFDSPDSLDDLSDPYSPDDF